MVRLLAGLLMIFFISGQTQAQELEAAFEIIQKLYEYGMKIYGVVDKHRNPDRTRENIEAIMTKVNEISTKIDTMESHLDIKLDAMLNTLLADIKVEFSLNTMRAKLRHSFSKLDRHFDDSREYVIGGKFGNQTLKDFAHKALWSATSVPEFLDDINEVFFPGGSENAGFLSVLHQRTMLNILHDCGKDVSTQQELFYIYIQVFMSEVKGLMAQTHCTMIERWFDATSYDYVPELEAVKDKFKSRLRRYHTLFTSKIPQFPTHIRECEASAPKRDVNYMELQKFSRMIILDPDFVKSEGCLWCPPTHRLRRLSYRSNATISNCKEIGNVITVCPAKSDSLHEYSWWKNEEGREYGPVTPCDNTRTIIAGSEIRKYSMSISGYTPHCKACACTIETRRYQNDPAAIWRVSITEQYSDFYHNNIVTGVRFVKMDNALHIQIRQAAVSNSGMVYHDNQWKDLDVGYGNAGTTHTKIQMDYETVQPDCKTLYLDDIKAPIDHVVTGVRFNLVDDSAFMLQIFVCPFKFELGEVSPFGCHWIQASTHPMYPDDYKRGRTVIDMGQADDPTRASEFQYEFQSNKQIDFRHTDINKDAGQTTIPLIDIQSVSAHPPFPLGGIGLSFRGRKGSGGYVAPRIFTFEYASSMKFPVAE